MKLSKLFFVAIIFLISIDTYALVPKKFSMRGCINLPSAFRSGAAFDSIRGPMFEIVQNGKSKGWHSLSDVLAGDACLEEPVRIVVEPGASTGINLQMGFKLRNDSDGGKIVTCSSRIVNLDDYGAGDKTVTFEARFRNAGNTLICDTSDIEIRKGN